MSRKTHDLMLQNPEHSVLFGACTDVSFPAMVGRLRRGAGATKVGEAQILDTWRKARAPRASTPTEWTSRVTILTMEIQNSPRRQENVAKSSRARHRG